MSERILITGQSNVASRIVNALGLEDYHVKSLELTIDPESPIRVMADIYLTQEQVQALGGELEKFQGFGKTIATVEFNYNYQ